MLAWSAPLAAYGGRAAAAEAPDAAEGGELVAPRDGDRDVAADAGSVALRTADGTRFLLRGRGAPFVIGRTRAVLANGTVLVAIPALSPHTTYTLTALERGTEPRDRLVGRFTTR